MGFIVILLISTTRWLIGTCYLPNLLYIYHEYTQNIVIFYAFCYKFPVEYLVLNKHNVFYSFNAVLILIKLIDLS